MRPRILVDKTSKWFIFKNIIKRFYWSVNLSIFHFFIEINETLYNAFEILFILVYILQIYYIYIQIRFPYIFLAFPEQQKICSGWFLFEAERKSKIAKQDIVGKQSLQQPM